MHFEFHQLAQFSWLSKNPPPLLGFGDGPRICSGIRLSMIEQRVILTKLIRNYRFHEIPETAVINRKIRLSLLIYVLGIRACNRRRYGPGEC